MKKEEREVITSGIGWTGFYDIVWSEFELWLVTGWKKIVDRSLNLRINSEKATTAATM